MKRTSIVGPLILIAIGGLFLLNNLRPDFSLLRIIAEFWPFLLIGWGALRLLEILFWAVRGKPLPVSGVSGSEWALVVLISILGSGLFVMHSRIGWPPMRIKMKGIEVFGEAYDYSIPDRAVAAGATPRIVIENSRGNVRISGAETTEVKVTGRKTVRAMDRQAGDDADRKTPLEVLKEGDSVIIRTNQERVQGDRFITADLEITVPKGARIEGRGRRGDFDITDVAGDIDLTSDNAGVRMQNVGGAVRVDTRASDIVRMIGVKGPVELKGFGHDLELENAESQVTVLAQYIGEVNLRNIAKPLRFDSGQTEFRIERCPGQVRLTRGNLSFENVAGPVVINARSKDVQVTEFTEGLELTLDRGDIELRPGKLPVPKMDVTTHSGRIELAMPEGAKFTLKATVRRGEIENDWGDALRVDEEGRGGTLAGQVGEGPLITLMTDRGAVRVRKAGAGEVAPRRETDALPKPPAPPRAPKELEFERN